MVADVERDEVIAIKRAGWSGVGDGRRSRGSCPSSTVSLRLPELSTGQARKVDVLVLSDGYVGLEHRIMGVEIPESGTRTS